MCMYMYRYMICAYMYIVHVLYMYNSIQHWSLSHHSLFGLEVQQVPLKDRVDHETLITIVSTRSHPEGPASTGH